MEPIATFLALAAGYILKGAGQYYISILYLLYNFPNKAASDFFLFYIFYFNFILAFLFYDPNQ